MMRSSFGERRLLTTASLQEGTLTDASTERVHQRTVEQQCDNANIKLRVGQMLMCGSWE